MVGFMSHRVLGQFDTGVPALDHEDMIVVPENIEAFSADHGLDTRQVRLWATMHELAHHAVLGVEWMRAHIIDVTGDFFAGVEFDMTGLMGGDTVEMEGVLIEARMTARWHAKGMVSMGLAVVALTLIAAIYPALRAAGMKPIDAIQRRT